MCKVSYADQSARACCRYARLVVFLEMSLQVICDVQAMCNIPNGVYVIIRIPSYTVAVNTGCYEGITCMCMNVYKISS